MKKSTLNILIGGPAGAGIESAGMMLGQALNRDGASVVVSNELMSLIRGGHNYNRVRFSFCERVFCHDETVDVAVVFDKAGVVEHLPSLGEGGVLIHEVSLEASVDASARDGVTVMGLDLIGAAKEAGGGKAGSEIYKNIVAIGVILGLLGEDTEFVEKLIREKFGDKGGEVVEANFKALRAGKELAGKSVFEVEKSTDFSGEMLLNGNDAVSLGSVVAGCKFVSAYPMTPASSIMATMAAWGKDKGIVMKHAEDEIAAINMIVGAGFAGARAMTATSGGGFALMTEAVGLAGCAEVPCVIVESQRVGPSTGLPTRTEQGDLRQVMHASQGDFPRLIMAPGDVRECFDMTFDAFNFADKYQVPVLLILDKYLSESWVSVGEFPTDGLKIERGKILNEEGLSSGTNVENGFFKRYADVPDGVSPRTLPGTIGGEHVTTSYETDEFSGLVEDRGNRIAQMNKRMRKMDGILGELDKPILIGAGSENGVGEGSALTASDFDILFVAFGSMKPILKEVVLRLEGEFGLKAGILMIKHLVPFHAKEVGEILRASKRIVLVEQNYSAMLGGVVTENTGFMFNEKVLKYDGRQMDANYIINKLGFSPRHGE